MKAKKRSQISADGSAVKAESVASLRPPAQVATRARRLRLDDALPPLILTPAMIASIIFVYAFIAITIWVSLSKWGTLRMDLNLREPFGFTYQQMFYNPFSDRVDLFWAGSSVAPGSKTYRPYNLAQCFFISLRTLFHCYRHCLAMDFQP
jgi:ABC-type sugar transport system permease subunit